MKQVVLIIGDRYQRTSSGFVREFARLGARPSAILCIRPEAGPLRVIRKALRPLNVFRPSALKSSIIRSIGGLCGLRPLAALRKSWNVEGENSWDLLEPGIDLFHFAGREGIPLHFAPLFSEEALRRYTAVGPTIFVAYAGGIIGKDLLGMENAEFVNAHMGEMPRYRGMNVIEWAVLERSVPKVSVMVMSEKIDGGDVIHMEEIPVAQARTIAGLRRAGYVACYHAMAAGVFNYLADPGVRRPQAKGGRYYYRMHPHMRARVQDILGT